MAVATYYTECEGGTKYPRGAQDILHGDTIFQGYKISLRWGQGGGVRGVDPILFLGWGYNILGDTKWFLLGTGQMPHLVGGAMGMTNDDL